MMAIHQMDTLRRSECLAWATFNLLFGHEILWILAPGASSYAQYTESGDLAHMDCIGPLRHEAVEALFPHIIG